MAPKRRSYTPGALAKSAELRREVKADLEKGFKWYKNNTTDGATGGNFDVSITPSGKITLRYKSARSFFNPGGSVMSKSVAQFKKIEYNGPVGEFYPFVHVKGAVKHYDWNGKLAIEF